MKQTVDYHSAGLLTIAKFYVKFYNVGCAYGVRKLYFWAEKNFMGRDYDTAFEI